MCHSVGVAQRLMQPSLPQVYWTESVLPPVYLVPLRRSEERRRCGGGRGGGGEVLGRIGGSPEKGQSSPGLSFLNL